VKTTKNYGLFDFQ